MGQANPPLAGDPLHADGDRQSGHHDPGPAADVDRLFAAAAAVPDDGDRTLHVRAALHGQTAQSRGEYAMTETLVDWRAETLERIRGLIKQAEPEAVEE